jgi:hypothetical protein
MVIDGRIPEGYVVVCNSRRDSHSFVVKQLGPSVECPKCGFTAMSTGLAIEFLAKRMRDKAAAVAR